MSAQRFTTRVESYIKYRPGYPAEVLELLRSECGLINEAIVADIGSGTGILSELILKNGNGVFGVEPNEAMRTAAEQLLQGYPGFTSINGSAENTTLPEDSVDLITAGQAFHWFDVPVARRELAGFSNREALSLSSGTIAASIQRPFCVLMKIC